MTAASAHALRPLVARAVKQGFTARGWTPRRGRGTTFLAPADWCDTPLTCSWDSVVDGDKYGGVRLTGSCPIRDEGVAAEVARYPVDCLPRTSFTSVDDLSAFLELTSTGILDLRGLPSGGGDWVIRTVDEVEPAVGQLFALIDGPFEEFVAARRTAALLVEVAVPDPRMRMAPWWVCSVSVLALRTGDVASARSLIDRFDTTRSEGNERMDRFEREVAGRYPEYGPLQRSA